MLLKRIFFLVFNVDWVMDLFVCIIVKIAKNSKYEDIKGAIISQAANQRTDNAMTKRKKKTKAQTMIYKTLHKKLKIEQDT